MTNTCQWQQATFGTTKMQVSPQKKVKSILTRPFIMEIMHAVIRAIS
jgi:hypothetical protein